MKYLIRNATSRLSYAGSVFLLDPAFAKKGTGPSYAGERRSPLVDMPCTMREAGSRTDAVVISHIHSDHFDAERLSVDEVARIRAEGVLKPNGRALATHISHEGMPLHAELSAFAEKHGYEVAWDGMVVEV